MFGEFPHQPEEGGREASWGGWTPPWMEGHGPQHGPHGPWRGFGGPWHGRHRGWRGPFSGPGRPWGIPEELLALRVQAAEVARLFAIASRGAFGNKERLAQLRAFLDRSHKELAEIIYGSAQESAQQSGEQPDSPPETGEA